MELSANSIHASANLEALQYENDQIHTHMSSGNGHNLSNFGWDEL